MLAHLHTLYDYFWRDSIACKAYDINYLSLYGKKFCQLLSQFGLVKIKLDFTEGAPMTK